MTAQQHIQQMTLYEAVQHGQISLINSEYEQAYLAFRYAWELGDRRQSATMIRCLLMGFKPPKYDKARQLYRQLTPGEKSQTISWFYLYYRKQFGYSKANKLLRLGEKLGAEFANTGYAHYYYGTNTQLAFKYFRRHYAGIRFNCVRPWTIKLATYLTYLPFARQAFIKAWHRFTYNKEHVEYAQQQQRSALAELKEEADEFRDEVNNKYRDQNRDR